MLSGEPLFAGPLVAGSIACGETQEEQLLGGSRGNVGALGFAGTAEFPKF